ncbi:putative Receptor-interacting protein [Heracleum sosnowskyi]|uniref:Receptor-interacting protein n=1 Tax=Heracleum sosnowskyi TaxID=360622 RepID=A0AAD8N0M8_9APIA|nr:putative Receptor-interacting protein [Heracleum sosnowskyi]
MNAIKPCNTDFQIPYVYNHSTYGTKTFTRNNGVTPMGTCRRKLKPAVLRASNTGGSQGEKRSFLSIEEAGMVEMSGLISHEKFLCRLTISSLNLLRVIAEQEGCTIEELNAGRVCDWFLKDKLKREQNLDSAVLQWDESNFQL